MIWHTAIVATFFVIAAHGCPASNEPESTTLEPETESTAPSGNSETSGGDSETSGGDSETSEGVPESSEGESDSSEVSDEETTDSTVAPDSEETPAFYMLDNGTQFSIY